MCEELPRLPASPLTLRGPGTYKPTREKKLKVIQYYLDLVGLLVPTDPVLRQPCLWHADLHTENIFVNPTKPTDVTGIIDWQSTEVAPFFHQVRQPYFLDYEGPQVRGLERPRLPPNLAQLPPKEQQQANRLFLNQSLCALYRTYVHKQNPNAWKCLEFQETPGFDLLLLARSLLVDGEATYMARIMELAESRSTFLRSNTPTCGSEQIWPSFTADEEAEIKSDLEGSLRGMDAMRGIQESLGELAPERGVVRPEYYDKVKDALRDIKEQVIAEFARTEEEKAAWREAWPFDD